MTITDTTVTNPAAPYRITGPELVATTRKITKVNKRCRRLGLPEVVLTSTPVTVWVRYTPNGTRLESGSPKAEPWFPMTMHDVTIAGGRPRLAGYELLALVEFLDAGAIVRTVPDLDASTIDRDTLSPDRCDHCPHPRHRVRVYLVTETSTGRILQIGTTCARDYLGLSVAPIFDTCVVRDQDDDEEGWGAGAGGRDNAPTVIAIATALADVRSRGFVPASAWDRGPTKDVVTATLWPSGDDHGLPGTTVDQYVAEARTLISHFATAPASDDFGLNLATIARSEWVTPREAGMVAAMPSAYDRAVGRIQARQDRDAERARSQHIGTPRERLSVTGTVRQVIELEAYSYYGPAPRLVIICTAEGNLVSWKTTAAIRTEIEVGQTLTLDGPVKAHEDRGYGKQTVIGGKGGRVRAVIVRE